MSPLSQINLLLLLFEAIRYHLGPDEHATLKVTARDAPCIDVRTERGTVIGSIDKDGMYTLDVAGAGTRYSCDPNDKRDNVYDMTREALNDARQEWT